jgi:hypothetical protein
MRRIIMTTDNPLGPILETSPYANQIAILEDNVVKLVFNPSDELADVIKNIASYVVLDVTNHPQKSENILVGYTYDQSTNTFSVPENWQEVTPMADGSSLNPEPTPTPNQ